MLTVVFDVDDFSLRDTFLRTFYFGALDALTPEHRPLWGLMTPQQMVEHLAWTFEVSTGKAEVDCPTPPDQIERMKRFLYSKRPSPHDYENPALIEGLPPLRQPDLRQARVWLLAEIDRFTTHQRTHPTALHTHPIFGPIGPDEWSRTHFKHGCHHLLQFELIDVQAWEAP